MAASRLERNAAVSDRIGLHGIRVYGRHGSDPGEQDVPQLVEVDVDIEVDLERSTHTDKLSDTVDYSELHRTITTIVAEHRYALLERLAQEIARATLHDHRIGAVTVRVAKPGLLAGATPSVTLRRTR